MAIQIQIRRGTSSEWSTSNPILAQGEVGYELNTGKAKVGDGLTAWNSLGYFNPNNSVTSVAMTTPTGLQVSGSPITTSGTLALTYASGYSIPTTSSQTNWDTAYADRLKWDGGSTGLTASTGRTSLGATTLGSNLFTITDPGAVTFPRFNADNSVSSLNASDFRTAIGAGTGNGSVTSVGLSVPTGFAVTGTPVTGSGTLALAFDVNYSLPTTSSQTNWDTAYTDRLKWDGGSTGLNASTGRTSLGLGTAATLNAGSANGVATLDGSGTVPTSQLPAAVLGGVKYQGTWNASTNTPTLASGTGTQGYYYVVSVAGSTNLDGITDWKIGDWAIYNGTAWQKVDNTDSVTSVNGYTGTVVLAASDVGAYPNTNPNGYTSNTGTVTSVAMTTPTGLSVSGSPITTTGTLALSMTAGYSIPTTASQTNWDSAYSERRQWDGGSTNLVASTGRTSLGATTLGSNLFTITDPGAITFPRFNADNTVSALTASSFRTAIGAGTGDGTVTSVGATSPVASSGGSTPTISLSSGYGDTQNPYASKTANFFLAAPDGSAGAPTFRAIVAADIPTLNQNTTGTASNVTGVVAIANGGSGQTTAQSAMNTFAGAVTSGSYLRGNGTDVVMSTIQAADVPTLNQNTTGTASNVTGTVAIANGGTGETTRQAAMDALAGAVTAGQYLRGNGTDVVMSAIQVSDVPTLNQNTTGTASNVTGTVAVANGGTGQTSYTDGQLLIGNSTGNTLTKATLTQGSGITITNGSGSISIDNAAPMTYPGAGIPNSTGTAWGTSYSTTGSGTVVALATSPSFTTPSLGVATATTINKVTFTAPATGSTLTIADGKTLTVDNSITFSGTDATTMTLPTTNATLAGLAVAQTFTATQTFSQINFTVNTVTVSANAGTVPITHRLHTFTNSSAAAMTITLATASAVDGQMAIVRIFDFSAAAQTINWVNTENSTVTVPTTSNGSTTLPLTVGFMYNNATSKWRCVASA